MATVADQTTGAAGFEMFLANLLRARHPIDENGMHQLATLQMRLDELEPGSVAVLEGEHVSHCSVLIEGFACRLKSTLSGERQILSLHIPGDFIDLQHLLVEVADHSIEVLTPAKVLRIDKRTLIELIDTAPAVGLALWRLTLIEGSRFREWMTNIGRRDAQSRVAHLLCEFIMRANPLAPAQFPMTQVQIADATGLTPGHVNRVLRHFAAIGAIRRNKRPIEVIDRNLLIDIAGFDPGYLH